MFVGVGWLVGWFVSFRSFRFVRSLTMVGWLVGRFVRSFVNDRWLVGWRGVVYSSSVVFVWFIGCWLLGLAWLRLGWFGLVSWIVWVGLVCRGCLGLLVRQV